ncbi:hypothetical protein DFH08DRAFT_799334 [Mycena albidolilacea]|uniref:Uncharacterized protein n=1 Tax=Mycena albidolilacea TaxID=1033008 RepID=A0AAD7ALG7_9AGAR|nr:hypothetical protein DFH08DRAFT_799334 [Mycena albidolilacea]
MKIGKARENPGVTACLPIFSTPEEYFEVPSMCFQAWPPELALALPSGPPHSVPQVLDPQSAPSRQLVRQAFASSLRPSSLGRPLTPEGLKNLRYFWLSSSTMDEYIEEGRVAQITDDRGALLCKPKNVGDVMEQGEGADISQAEGKTPPRAPMFFGRINLHPGFWMRCRRRANLLGYFQLPGSIRGVEEHKIYTHIQMAPFSEPIE